jgi:4,5-DOPA dioxygenase extradiol
LYDVVKELPRPKGVLCISAHWETYGVFLTGSGRPETMHDFYGFPKELFDVRYPAPGDPALAGRTAALLSKKGARLDAERGLDHGCWSVPRAMFLMRMSRWRSFSLDRKSTPRAH